MKSTNKIQRKLFPSAKEESIETKQLKDKLFIENLSTLSSKKSYCLSSRQTESKGHKNRPLTDRNYQEL